MATEFELKNNFKQVKTGITIAIILGLAISVFFLIIEAQSYSAIYLLPESIIHNPDDSTVLYTYGITSSETQKMDYTLDTYVNDELINTKQFSLNTRETLEERVKTVLPVDVQYPAKITLIFTSSSETESVHFWVDNITQ